VPATQPQDSQKKDCNSAEEIHKIINGAFLKGKALSPVVFPDVVEDEVVGVQGALHDLHVVEIGTLEELLQASYAPQSKMMGGGDPQSHQRLGASDLRGER
jgi:hypothetical protein